MITSKVICNDTYSNKSWSIVSQGMFQLWEINQMECEVHRYLDSKLNVEPGALNEFTDMVRKDFAGPGPYPTYVLQTVSRLATTSTNPSLPLSLTTQLLLPASAPDTHHQPSPHPCLPRSTITKTHSRCTSHCLPHPPCPQLQLECQRDVFQLFTRVTHCVL